MTVLASWPASNAGPAGCRAFDSEAAAETFARHLTAAGHPRVVVYEIVLPNERQQP